jgi:hypothetical protein
LVARGDGDDPCVEPASASFFASFLAWVCSAPNADWPARQTTTNAAAHIRITVVALNNVRSNESKSVMSANEALARLFVPFLPSYCDPSIVVYSTVKSMGLSNWQTSAVFPGPFCHCGARRPFRHKRPKLLTPVLLSAYVLSAMFGAPIASRSGPVRGTRRFGR